MGPLEDMTVRLLKEVLDNMNLTYKTNEKKADLIEKDCHARVSLLDEYYDQSNRCHVISSSEYQSPYENCSTCTFINGPIFLFYYDEQKERLS